MADRRDEPGGYPGLFELFCAGVEVFPFEGFDHLAEADVAGVGVDAAAAAGEDVVGVGVADGASVARRDFGAGWGVRFAWWGFFFAGHGGWNCINSVAAWLSWICQVACVLLNMAGVNLD